MTHDAHLRTPAGRPRARGLGIPFDGIPGTCNAITDVPGVEVGYTTLIGGEGPLVVGEGPVRTGVTAIHPRGRADPGTPCAAGFFSLNGNGEMTGTVWIEEAGALSLPVTITNTHAVGHRAGGHDRVDDGAPSAADPRVGAPGRGRDLGRLSQRHQRPPRHAATSCSPRSTPRAEARSRRARSAAARA